MFISQKILNKDKKVVQLKEESIVSRANAKIQSIVQTFVNASQHEVNNLGLPTIENSYSNEILKMKKVPNSVFEKNKEKVIKGVEEKLKIEGSTQNMVGTMLQGFLEKSEKKEKKQVVLDKEKKRISKELKAIEEIEKEQHLNLKTYIISCVGKIAAKIGTNYGIVGPILMAYELLSVVPVPMKKQIIDYVDPVH